MMWETECCFSLFLNQANADVSAVDEDGRTPLFYSRRSGSQELVNLLLSHGCGGAKNTTKETMI